MHVFIYKSQPCLWREHLWSHSCLSVSRTSVTKNRQTQTLSRLHTKMRQNLNCVSISEILVTQSGQVTEYEQTFEEYLYASLSSVDWKQISNSIKRPPKLFVILRKFCGKFKSITEPDQTLKYFYASLNEINLHEKAVVTHQLMKFEKRWNKQTGRRQNQQEFGKRWNRQTGRRQNQQENGKKWPGSWNFKELKSETHKQAEIYDFTPRVMKLIFFTPENSFSTSKTLWNFIRCE